MPGEGPFAAIPGSVKAAVWLLLSGLSFVGMIVLVRLCAAEMHPLNLAVWACLMALLWLLPTLLSDPGLLRREPLSREAGVRALLAVVATEALFAAVTSAPFAPVVALLSLAPVVAGPGRVGGRAMLPTAVAALCGAVLLLSEAAPATYPGLAAAAAAVLAAAATIRLRRAVPAPLGARSGTFWVFLLMLPMAAVVAVPVAAWPAANLWPLLVGLGACAASARLAFARALAFAGRRPLVAHDIGRFGLAALAGIALFGERYGPVTLGGGALVLLASALRPADAA
jgi:drug/metabolite transporter (DMT)-like permease